MEPVKRRDVGMTGLLIVASQLISTIHSWQGLSSQINELKTQLVALKSEREEFFVKKTEMAVAMKKIDQMASHVSALKDQVSIIRTKVEDNFSLEECDPLLTALRCDEVAARD